MAAQAKQRSTCWPKSARWIAFRNSSPAPTNSSSSNPNASTLSFSLAGAPAGLAIGVGGSLSWAVPVAGSYAFTVTVRDGYGMSTSRGYTLVVEPAVRPAATASLALSARAGVAFGVRVQAGRASAWAISGAPAGLALDARTGTLTWARPVRGSYAFRMTGSDAQGVVIDIGVTLAVAG